MLKITSLQNPKVKQIVRLRERRERDETKLFLIEGYREISRAQRVSIETLFYSPHHFLGENEPALIAQCEKRGAQIVEVVPSVFEKISYRDRPDGLLAVAHQWELSLLDIEQKWGAAHAPFLLVAESIEKPGNLGTILRSCDAVGVDGVIVCDRCTDIFNPNVVRASVGTLFTQPVVETAGLDTLRWLKKNGIKIVATTPAAEKIYTHVDLTGPVAIAMGTEQIGLSQAFLEQADIQVRIPMCGVADSLNVASATTLILYEVLRQRDAAQNSLPR